MQELRKREPLQDVTNEKGLGQLLRKTSNSGDYVFNSWLRSDQMRGLPPQTWGLLPNLQLLVADACLLRTSQQFQERRMLLSRSYAADAVFEDPLALCEGQVPALLYNHLWACLIPQLTIEGRPPKLPTSKAGHTQVCFSSVHTLKLPRADNLAFGLLAALPETISFEVVTTLCINTSQAIIVCHSETWVGSAGSLRLPVSARRWVAWLSGVTARVWIITSGVRRAVSSGIWPMGPQTAPVKGVAA